MGSRTGSNQSIGIDDARAAFREVFGREATCGVRAPGRINWIGEHTDYEEGLVLPSAIDRDTIVLAAPEGDRRVDAHSAAEGRAAFDLDRIARQETWIDYVQGVAWSLGQAGHRLPGANLWIGSRVPAEAGLSSSAALGVAVVLVFERLAELELGGRERALAAHRGESEFVGIGCGILDPFASALARAGCALRIDCRDRSVEEVPLAAEGACLLVAESGVGRRLAAGGYRERVDECRALFREARESGVLGAEARALRDLRIADLAALESRLAPRLVRRARHIVTENARVDAVARALSSGDLREAGRLLCEGQASLRDDYEVSVPELDLLCELADAEAGTYGSRLTGAGWGGCTLHLADEEAAEDVADAVREGFARRYGRRPRIHRLTTAEGASALF